MRHIASSNEILWLVAKQKAAKKWMYIAQKGKNGLHHNAHAHAVALWPGIGVVLCPSSFDAVHCMRSLNMEVHRVKAQPCT